MLRNHVVTRARRTGGRMLPVSLHLSLGLLALAREPPHGAPGFARSLAAHRPVRRALPPPAATCRVGARPKELARAHPHPRIWQCRPRDVNSCFPARYGGAAWGLWAVSAGGGEGGAYGKRASSGASLLPPPVRGPALHVYVFVTIVGWGKNTLLDVMLPEIRGQEPCPTWHLGGGADAADGEMLPGLFDGPDFQPPVILESDTIGAKKFWPAVQEAISRTEDATVHHLFLNKNLPPNAWQGAKRKLVEYCKSSNRSLILYAVVPSSPGSRRNAFSLVDLGVCLASVQSRVGHPNLGQESEVTASVAATFYNLYNFRGGRAEFLERLEQELTDNIIPVSWISPEAYPRAPLTMTGKMTELLARMGQARRNDKIVNLGRNSLISSASTAPLFTGAPSSHVTRRGEQEGAGRSVSSQQRGSITHSERGSEGARRSSQSRDEVSATAMALEIECRQLMAEAEVADFVKGARLSKTDVLLSFLEGTRRVRKRLAL